MKKEYTCCVCKDKVISRIDPSMWADGTVSKITFGYGSIHDTDSYYIAICDECITELKESGLI